MKKSVSLVAAVSLSLASFGALEKVGTLQLADVDSLVKGISTLGEFTGNPMLGIMASQAVWKIPQIRLFGNGRPGEAMAYVAYAETDGKSCAIENLRFATLYPVAQSKQDFTAAHPDAVEEGGVLRMHKDGDNSFAFVAFSDDGKWASAGEDRDSVVRALEDIKSASRKMEGTIVRLSLPRRGLSAFAELAEEASKLTDDASKVAKTSSEVEKTQALLAKMREQRQQQIATVVSNFTDCVIGIGASDRGLDVRFALKPVKGSAYDGIGRKTLPSDWISYTSTAVFAADSAACLYNNADVTWDEIAAVLAKYGIDCSFVSHKRLSEASDMYTIDAAAACAAIKKVSENAEKISKDGDGLFMDLLAFTNRFSSIPDPGKHAHGGALVLKGFKPIADVQTRFERTLPEAKRKPLFSRCFLSYYSAFKGLVPVILANVEEEQRAMLAPMLNSLPPEGPGGIAMAQWRDGALFRGILRVAPDEFKGLAAGMTLFTTMKMNGLPASAPTKAK